VQEASVSLSGAVCDDDPGWDEEADDQTVAEATNEIGGCVEVVYRDADEGVPPGQGCGLYVGGASGDLSRVRAGAAEREIAAVE